MRENKFQAGVIRDLRKMFPGCVILKNDANYLQGVPDILLLWGRKWAALECKPAKDSASEPNQTYYVNLMKKMSFAEFIFPENREHVLNALQQSLRPSRTARLPKAQ